MRFYSLIFIEVLRILILKMFKFKLAIYLKSIKFQEPFKKIKNKGNSWLSPWLSEEEFRVKWNHLTGEKEEYEYEELENNRTITENASY